MKRKTRRRTCVCGSKHTDRVGYIVDNEFKGVTRVDEDYEHTFIKPSPVFVRMTIKQWFKLSLLLSLFFTPFCGPLMALAIKMLYDGKLDEKLTKKAMDEWKRQGFCFKCGITWTEAI